MQRAAVLIVEDDELSQKSLCDTLSSERQLVIAASSVSEALSILEQREVDLVISDLDMEEREGLAFFSSVRRNYPQLPAVLISETGSIRDAVRVMRGGASDYLVKPIDPEEIRRAVGRYLQPIGSAAGPVAVDPASRELLRIAGRVAKTEATVTISGASGTGKEVFARYIHENSARSAEPFIAINCAAIPDNMLEAVLFGHEKGAFTGASSAHAGKFEQANNGTLLLDEVSEMDIGLQAKLLRVLQEKEVERIGGKSTISLNVRVLATTNRDLRQYVADGKFREDLYYRLNVFPLHIPRLAERTGDILPLAEMALQRYARTTSGAISITDDAAAALRAHRWPGNVRELENLIQRTLILLQGPEISRADLAFESPCDRQDSALEEGELQSCLRSREHKIILDALSANNGKRSKAADLLGISPRTLRYKIARMRSAGVPIPGDEKAETESSSTNGVLQ